MQPNVQLNRRAACGASELKRQLGQRRWNFCAIAKEKKQ